jgi:hypothetical protein
MHRCFELLRTVMVNFEQVALGTNREGGLGAGEVRLQLRAVGAVAHEGEVRRGAQRLQHRPQRLEVLLCWFSRTSSSQRSSGANLLYHWAAMP